MNNNLGERVRVLTGRTGRAKGSGATKRPLCRLPRAGGTMVAALVAALFWFALPAPAGAQTQLLSTKLTVGENSLFRGYLGGLIGSLGDTDFTFKDTQHDITQIRISIGEAELALRFEQAPHDDLKPALLLQLGDATFMGSDATLVQGLSLNWSNSGLSWNKDDEVDVTLSVIELPVTITPGNGELTISWRVPSSVTGDSTITSYDIRHRPTTADDSGTWTVIDPAWTSGDLEYTISNLTNGQAYDVQVRAVDDMGDGTWSATSTGTPQEDNVAPTLTVRPGRHTPGKVSARAGQEVAALQVELHADGAEIPVTSLTVRVRTGGPGVLADIARVTAYHDANGNGQSDVGEQLLGVGEPDATGTVTITPGSLRVPAGARVHLAFGLQLKPSLSAAAGIGLVGGVLTMAAARCRRRGAAARGAGRRVAAALLALTLVLAVAGCQEGVPPKPQPRQEPEPRTFQLTLTAVEAAPGADAVVRLPAGGIAGPTVAIDGQV